MFFAPTAIKMAQAPTTDAPTPASQQNLQRQLEYAEQAIKGITQNKPLFSPDDFQALPKIQQQELLESYFTAGVTARLLGKNDDALDYFGRYNLLIQLEPDQNIKALNQLKLNTQIAITQQAMGDLDIAHETYQEAIKNTKPFLPEPNSNQPNDFSKPFADASINLGVLLTTQGLQNIDPATQSQFYKKAHIAITQGLQQYNTGSTGGYGYARLALIQALTNEPEAAHESIKQARNLRGKSNGIQTLATAAEALAYLKQGNMNEANKSMALAIVYAIKSDASIQKDLAILKQFYDQELKNQGKNKTTFTQTNLEQSYQALGLMANSRG
jgi:tetratricopeptide (TPR) repeat protein